MKNIFNRKIIGQLTKKNITYKYTISGILEAAYHHKIDHIYNNKKYNYNVSNVFNVSTIKWTNDAELNGFYKEIKLKYLKLFECKKKIFSTKRL